MTDRGSVAVILTVLALGYIGAMVLMWWALDQAAQTAGCCPCECENSPAWVPGEHGMLEPAQALLERR